MGGGKRGENRGGVSPYPTKRFLLRSKLCKSK